MRYVNLSFVYTMSQVCTRVKKRFPTLDHLVEAGGYLWRGGGEGLGGSRPAHCGSV